MSIISYMADILTKHILDNYDQFKMYYGMFYTHEEDFIAKYSYTEWPLIKELRKERHLTQQDIADKIGISRIAYQNIECGKSTPRLETMSKLINIFEKEEYGL